MFALSNELRRYSLTGAAAALALVAGLTSANAAGSTKPSLAQAVRVQNARHIDEAQLYDGPASTILQSTDAVPGGQGPWSLTAGKLQVSVTAKKQTTDDGDMVVLVVTLTVDGKAAYAGDAGAGYSDPPIFLVQVAEMDPSNPYPEVVVSTFTGGAHCCSDTRLITASADGKSWSEVKAGAFDGDLIEASDVDYDGRYEIATRDNRFLYAFDCYACSTAPLQILRLDKGKLADVSADPAFRDAQVSHLVRMILGPPPNSPNGFLAGYVAAKIRLGEGAEAWTTMLAHYDHDMDIGLTTCQGAYDNEGNCKGKVVTVSFPDALRKFLKENGYPPPPE